MDGVDCNKRGGRYEEREKRQKKIPLHGHTHRAISTAISSRVRISIVSGWMMIVIGIMMKLKDSLDNARGRRMGGS
jgi:hypothetical protein